MLRIERILKRSASTQAEPRVSRTASFMLASTLSLALAGAWACSSSTDGTEAPASVEQARAWIWALGTWRGSWPPSAPRPRASAPWSWQWWPTTAGRSWRGRLEGSATRWPETARYRDLVVGMWNERAQPESPTFAAWRASLKAPAVER